MAALPPHSAAIERRASTEIRADPRARKIEGYAATYGAEADLGSFVETIVPGAFRAALGNDILALHDHDMGKVLGRTRSGSLKLLEDSKGLSFELSVPETQAGRDVLALAERGDLGGMSFGFRVPDGGESWDGRKRSLSIIDLREISIVSAFPAYPDTEIALRAFNRGCEAMRRRRVLIMAEAAQWAS